MSGPEFEGVLEDHARQGGTVVHSCLCGWTPKPGEYHRAHLSVALHAELARWAGELADEWDACDEHGNPLREGSLGEAADELRAALANPSAAQGEGEPWPWGEWPTPAPEADQ